MALSITTHCRYAGIRISEFRAVFIVKLIVGRHDFQRNDTQHNDIHHNDTQHNDIQHNSIICDTRHKLKLSLC
jgi:hypothetical protein